MKTLVLLAMAAGLGSPVLAQNAATQADSGNSPQENTAVHGNRDPGAEQVSVPKNNPGSTSVDRSTIEAPRTSDHTSDRVISREWQGLGSTGGGTGTGTSSGTVADEVAPGQDGNSAANDNGANNQSEAGASNRDQPTSQPRQ